MRKVIKLFIFGVLIGTFVGLWLSIAFSGIATKGAFYGSMATKDFTWETMLISSLLWGLLGGWMGMSNAVFDWFDSLTTATIAHAIAIYIPLVLVAFHEKWLTLHTVVSFTVQFIVIYFCIWFVLYHAIKKQIQAINQKLS